MKEKLMLLIILFVSLSLTACKTGNKNTTEDVYSSNTEINNQALEPDALEDYDLAGFITEINTRDNLASLIFVEAGDEKSGDGKYDQAFVTIGENTAIFTQDLVLTDKLDQGQYVKVFFEPDVNTDSLPIQAVAKQIYLVEPPVLKAE